MSSEEGRDTLTQSVAKSGNILKTWGAGECFPSPHTFVAEAATLLGWPLEFF